MENIKWLGQIFCWKKDHPTLQNHLKSRLSIAMEQKEDQEQLDIPKIFMKIEEGECHIEEAKPPKWMYAETKMKEFDISNDGRPNMV
jgi:hypothetical protein